MEIFKFEHYQLQINPIALKIKAFKDVWVKYRNKEHAMMELTYVWLMASYTSDFSGYLDRDQRKDEIIKSLFQGDPGKIKIDKKTDLAIEKLEELQITPALSFLRSAQSGMNKIKKHIDDMDIHDSKDADSLLNLIAKAPNIVKSLSELEEKVKKEAAESAKIKGGREKGMMEDPD